MIPIASPSVGDEEIKAITTVISSGIIAQGPKVREAEEKFAKLCGTKYAIAFNSGTAAIHTALRAIGIKKGDEVITTPFSFIATATPILMQGATPVFADIDKDTFNIAPESIKEKITPKTKAIITVDLFGQLCNYDEINKIAEENNLIVIEDACQAINAELDGKKAGTLGSLGTFSLYATKNITCGEGGMLVTNNQDQAENAKQFRQHGRSKMTGYEYMNLGYNYRTTDLNAAILLEQLKKLDSLTNKRIENAEYLSNGLKDIKGIKVPSVKNGKHVYNQFTIKLENFKLSREELMEKLKQKGISSAIYYPKPLHLLEVFKHLGYKEGDCPVAEKLCKQVLSLPIHPAVSKNQLDEIINVIKELA